MSCYPGDTRVRAGCVQNIIALKTSHIIKYGAYICLCTWMRVGMCLRDI